MILNCLIISILILMALRLFASLGLEVLNLKSLSKFANAVPSAFADFITLQDYSNINSYTKDKTYFDMVEDSFNACLVALLLLFGFFPWAFDLFETHLGLGVWAQAITFIGVSIMLSLPSLPFEIFDSFVIEEKHGFNKSSFTLWLTDKLKELAISLVLGIPLLALLIWFFESFENTWWILAFLAISLFQLVMLVLYPKFIMPLFNKITPLEDGALKDRLFALAQKGDFKASAIYVIDGSRRSGHSNAYFTGFGKFRRIVLYDTLIAQLSIDELEGVLAHEIGHYKKGHIYKLIGMGFISLFAAFAVMGWLSQTPEFFEMLGFKHGGMGQLLMLVTLFSGLITFWFTPIMNVFSRKYEYESDAFAKKLCGGAQPLVSALRKLQKENRSNLTPHPIYSAFYYSHPTLIEREDALK